MGDCKHPTSACVLDYVSDPKAMGGISKVITCGACGAETREWTMSAEDTGPPTVPVWSNDNA